MTLTVLSALNGHGLTVRADEYHRRLECGAELLLEDNRDRDG
jgi:hypothetical protein